MELISSELSGILGYTIFGVSVGSLLGILILLVCKIGKLKISKASIEESFKKAVLPSQIRIDVSGKVVPQVENALKRIETKVNEALHSQASQLVTLKEELSLCLSILSKFSHAELLTDEEKLKLSEFVNPDDISDVEV